MEINLINLLIGLSIFFNVYCFFPYLKDIFSGSTKPHIYTWFIWFVSQLVALMVIWNAGGGFASVVVLVNVILILFIVLLSIKYGTKNITNFDKYCLIMAGVTLISYFYFSTPLVSLVFAILTDVLGYLPTIRKVLFDPKSETASFYLISVFSNICLLLSLSTYNVNTYLYPISMAVVNFSTFYLIYYLVKKLKKNNSIQNI